MQQYSIFQLTLIVQKFRYKSKLGCFIQLLPDIVLDIVPDMHAGEECTLQKLRGKLTKLALYVITCAPKMYAYLSNTCFTINRLSVIKNFYHYPHLISTPKLLFLKQSFPSYEEGTGV